MQVGEMRFQILQRLALREVVEECIEIAEPRLAILPVGKSGNLHARKLLTAVAQSGSVAPVWSAAAERSEWSERSSGAVFWSAAASVSATPLWHGAERRGWPSRKRARDPRAPAARLRRIPKRRRRYALPPHSRSLLLRVVFGPELGGGLGGFVGLVAHTEAREGRVVAQRFEVGVGLGQGERSTGPGAL